MKSGTIATGSQQLHYLQWGSGPKLLLALHGYSNSAGMFSALATRLEGVYTTIALDLPFHGKSAWSGTQPWTAEELTATVQELLRQHGQEKLSLTGFSLGGRICLKLAELMPERIGRMTLIAPDGLVPNSFYRFVTANAAGKRLFAHFLEKPQGYMSLLAWLEERRLLDASKRKFVEQYVSAGTAREFLKKVWPNLRLLVPDQQQVRRNIERYAIPTHLFMGRYDRVIPLKHAETFAAGATHVQLHILEKGHRVMDEGSIGAITQTLLPA